ncbi:MAG: hypothetical protein PHO76_06850 [Methylotenera sp.]|nr:hypothetical protein [Methylotenera sp.]MDD4926395.1 hypothetical protein [Methylotenera sp.]
MLLASRAEYEERKTLYNLAKIAAAAKAKTNAVIGSKLNDKAVKTTPNEPKRRCRAAERVKTGFAIKASFFSTLLQSHEESGMEPFRLCCHFLVFTSHDGGSNPTGRY